MGILVCIIDSINLSDGILSTKTKSFSVAKNKGSADKSDSIFCNNRLGCQFELPLAIAYSQVGLKM
jgi:hypothetical protein